MAYYITPKTDWAVPDIVQTTDMNQIGLNLECNRLGGGETALPSFAIAADLSLDLVHSFFLITGSITTINRIEFTDGSTTRQNGNIITLIFDTDATINTTAATNSSTHAGIIASVTSININQYDCLQFIITGSGASAVWYPIHVHNTGNG